MIKMPVRGQHQKGLLMKNKRNMFITGGIILSVACASIGTGCVVKDTRKAVASERPEGTPPAMPEGSGNPDGAPPAMPGSSGMPDGNPPDGEGGQPGGAPSSGVDSYDAVKAITSDTTVSGEIITSTGKDENAVLVTSGNVSLQGSTIVRESSDSTGGDNSSFYGVGAAVLATGGIAKVSSSKVTADAAGGAGLFAYNTGKVYVADTTVTTKKDTSGGIHAAGGGTLYAWDVTVETSGKSSAAIRSDRGGGTMVVDGGSYTSNGVGSPAIYSTADIAVSDAALAANASEAICIEGRNSIHLYDCSLSGNMGDDSQNDCTWNVILYQSMSGDSQVGNSIFQMQGGTLTGKNGGMFYTTNTESTFTLSNVAITNASDSEYFLRCTGNKNARGWGSSGSNGADCLFTGIKQEMNGDVVWDSISKLDMYLTEGSSLTGAVRQDESCAGNGGDGYCSIYISKDSTWTVTGDSAVTNLYHGGTICDDGGNVVTVQGADGTVYIKGDSAYTITVGKYSTEADLSGASKIAGWSGYQVERPADMGGNSGSSTSSEDKAASVKKTKIVSVKRSSNKKKVALELKKSDGASGYQVSCSTSKKFGKKTTVSRKGKKTAVTVTGLKEKKQYYVRARAYRIIDGKTYYSGWTKVRNC